MTLRKAGCLVTSPTRCPSIHRSGGRARKPSMYSAPVRAAIPFASWWSESVEARTDVLLGLSVLPSGRLADDDAQLGPDRDYPLDARLLFWYALLMRLSMVVLLMSDLLQPIPHLLREQPLHGFISRPG